MIYPNDHRPAHVHLIGNGCEAVFDLRCPAGPPELRENDGYARKQLSRMAAGLHARVPVLRSDWRRIHGYH